MPESTFKPFILAADVTELYDDVLFSAALECVDNARKEKISKLKLRKDKNLSLGAGLLLEQAFKRAGIEKGEIIIGKNGKPYIKNSDFYFNLSHSGNYAVCAAAPYPIGCDIELREDVNLSIAERFFKSEEYEDIISDKNSTEKFYRYWTLKESFMKATGLGMSLPLDSFSVVLENPPEIKSETVKEKYFFKEFFDISGYACALCGKKDCSNTELILINDIKTLVGNDL